MPRRRKEQRTPKQSIYRTPRQEKVQSPEQSSSVKTTHSPIAERPANPCVKAKELFLLFKDRTWLAALIVLCTLLTIGWSLIRRAAPTTFSTSFRGITKLSLSFQDSQDGAISPTCGCLSPAEIQHWRGLTFVNRDLTLFRQSVVETNPPSGYQIFAAPKEEVAKAPSAYAYQITQYSVALDHAESLRIEDFRKRTVDPTNLRGEIRTLGRVTAALFLTNQPLRITVLGEYPISSYIPVERSNIAVTIKEPLFSDDAGVITINERYDAATRTEESDGETYIVDRDLPALDVVGPDIAVWSEDSSARIFLVRGVSNELLTFAPQKRGMRNVNILVVRMPFSARIIPYAVDAPVIDGIIAEPKKAARPHLIVTPRDQGSVTLTLNAAGTTSKEYEQVVAAVKQHPTVAPSIQEPINPKIDVFMSMDTLRYPPLPPFLGINIWGALRRLSVSGVTGSIVIEANQHEIPAPATVEFDELSNFKDARGDLLTIPVELGTNAKRTSSEWTGEGQITLNGKPAHRTSDVLVGPLSLLLAYIAAVALLSNLRRVVGKTSS